MGRRSGVFRHPFIAPRSHTRLWVGTKVMVTVSGDATLTATATLTTAGTVTVTGPSFAAWGIPL